MINDDQLRSISFTSSQKEIWLAQLASLSEHNEVAIRVSFPIKNKVSPIIFKKAIITALRHTPLPCSLLCTEDGEPCFKSLPVDDIDFRFVDVSKDEFPQQAAHRYLDVFFEESVEKKLIHFALLRTGENESVYAIKCSHLVFDGLAVFLHIEFVADIYSAFVHGKDFPISKKCLCDDSSLKDASHFKSPRWAKDIAFWEEHLKRIPEKRIFRARPGFADVLGHSRFKKYYLSEKESASIDEIISRYGVSPAVYFTAVHALIISFMCDEKQFAVLMPVAFGERKSYNKRQGAQISTPPVFIDLDRHDSFESLLDGIASQSSSFFRHIRTPYQVAMRNLENKNLAYLTDTFINYLPHSPVGNSDFHVLTVNQQHSPKEEVVLGALVLQETETKQYSFTVHSSCNHFSEQDIERYIKRIEWLSAQINDGVELSKLNYLLEEENSELLNWQHGKNKKYAVKTIYDLFDEKAALFPDSIAVKAESGATISYAGLKENSYRCAAWLTGKGVTKGDIVAVFAERNLNLPEVLLGIMRCGAVYLPLDPKSPAERLDYIVSNSEAVLTIAPGKIDYADFKAESKAVDAVFTSPPVHTHDGAYLIYTSGSTGRPKGVLAPHDGFINMIQGQIDVFGLCPDDHVLQFASPAFDASLSEIFMALLSGATLYPVSDSLRNEPWALKEYMAESGISVVTFPPSYLHLFGKEDFSDLRVLITAGEAPIAADALYYAGRLDYFNAYGPTETCVCASVKKVSATESLPISSGRPIPNGAAYILNSEKSLLPAGMVGSLWIGGQSLALGYFKNEQLTGERFCPLAAASNQTVYATGDLALWSEDGEIVLVGRSDDQVKVRGNRVELGEAVFLIEKCAAVSQAFVMADKNADGQTMLAAFIVLSPGATLNEVIDWSKNNLPTYMIPSLWRVLSSMPVTVTGKIDRGRLKNLIKNENQENCVNKTINSELLNLCESVLGRKCEPEVCFFDQGGNSLAAMSFLHEIRNSFSVDLSFRDLVKCDNLFELEALLEKKRPKKEKGAYDTARLSGNQFQLWAYQQANENSVDYNMPFLLEIKGAQADAFLQSFLKAVKAQAMLSCIVDGDIDKPFFRYRESDISFQLHEFSDFKAFEEYFQQEIHKPFNLREESPFKVQAARTLDGLYLFALIHHLAGDGESFEILLKSALRSLHGETPFNASLSTQDDFCRRELEYLGSADFQSDKDYWNEKLTPAVAALSSSSKGKGAMAKTKMDAATINLIEKVANKSGATSLSCFSTLLGGFLCHKYQRPELFIGVPVGLRETQEEFNSVGYYVNTVVLRLKNLEGVDIGVAVKETSTQLREAILHSRYLNPIVPDVLATHSNLEDIDGQDLLIKRMSPFLNASKFTASFTLETGAQKGIILEYDAFFIKDASSILEEFKEYIATKLHGRVARSRIQLFSEAWQDILHHKPDEQSDFFRDGGDSIKAIQITGNLHRNNIKTLTAADFLRTSSFADLCKMLGENEISSNAGCYNYARAKAGQSVPLLPLQKELICRHPEHWKSFYMLLPMEISSDVSQEKIEEWLQTLPSTYEALRLSFEGETATILQKPQKIILKNCFFDSDLDRNTLFRKVLKVVLAGFDPEVGRTFGAALAEQDGKRFLFLVGHHLVIDTFSMDVLRRDLMAFCRGETRQAEVYGIATRAVEVEKLLAGSKFPAKKDALFWESVCNTPAGKLIAAKDDHLDLAAERVLKTEQLEGFRIEYTKSAPADILASFAVALHKSGQRDAVFVTLESHGRDSLLPEFDLSRSVGWFTAVCPLPLISTPSYDEAFASIAPFLNEFYTPLSCNSFGYLRSKNPDQFRYDAQISFNYFGKLSAEKDQDFISLMTQAMPGSIPELLHPDFEPESRLELIVFFDEAGVLNLCTYFNPQVLNPDWVSNLLRSWIFTLKSLPAYKEPLPQELRDKVLEISFCKMDDVEEIITPDEIDKPMLYQSLAEDKSYYTQQIEFYFKGEIDDFLLTKAWEKVVSRHESLRSLFPMPFEGEFYRLILKKARVTADYHDLSNLPEPLAQRQLEDLLKLDRERGFDLNKGPLLRSQLYRLGSDRFMISWCFHHLLMDGWCIGILLRELFSSYDILKDDLKEELPEPMPRAKFLQWSAEFDAAAAKNYWDSLLKDFVPLTGFATHSPSSEQFEPETYELVLEVGLSSALKNAAGLCSVTLPVFIQALWAVLLSAENNTCRDVVYGVVTSGRPAEIEGIEEAVGLFIRTLPLRAKWTEQSSFEELLALLKEQSLNQMEYGYLPLAAIGRDLFDHILVFENYPFENLFEQESLELTAIHGFEKIPYPFSVSVIPGDNLKFRFLFNPAKISQATIQNISSKLHDLIEFAIRKESISCQSLEAVIPHEESRDNKKDRTILGRFRSVVAKFSDKTACADESGRSLTYAQLDKLSDLLAGNLGKIEKGEPVAVLMPRSIDALIAFLGILKSGGCYLPLDEKSPDSRKAVMLKEASCRRIIVPDETSCPFASGCAITNYPSLLESGAGLNSVEPAEEDPAYIMFTSGSSGTPKGVIVPHRAVYSLVCNGGFWDVSPDEAVIQSSSLGFDGSTLEIWGSFLNGLTLYLIDEVTMSSPELLRPFIFKNRITRIWVTASLCEMLVTEDQTVFEGLKALYTGGEVLKKSYIGRILSACPKLAVYNGYGPTENTTFTTTHRITLDDMEKDSIPIGKPISGGQVYIVTESGRFARTGEWGEIYASGDGLANGYIGTADGSKFGYLEALPDVRTYRTGDFGRWLADGTIEFGGRKDSMVKLRGYRIELEEIENCFLNIPAVKAARVIVQDTALGPVLSAFICGDESEESSIKDKIRSSLPSYMIPERIFFLEKFPLNLNGKLDKEQLSAFAGKNEYSVRSPQNDIESVVLSIYENVLNSKVPSIDADFFALGGHSLLAMQVLAGVCKRLSVKLKIEDILSYPTVRGLAAFIAKSTTAAAKILQVPQKKSYPLSISQKRIWFLQRLHNSSRAYQIPFAARLGSDLDCDLLQKALTMLEVRHDALRLRVSNDEPVQKKVLPGSLQLEICDYPFSAWTGADEELEFGFDSPLVRVSLFKEANSDFVLLMRFHHIIFDGWSGEIFIRELNQAYDAVLNGGTPDWSNHDLDYVSYVEWELQQDSTGGDILKKNLLPLPENLKLPLDYPRPSTQSLAGDVLVFELSPEQGAALKGYARELGVTIFPVLLALVETFIYRHTGQNDMIIGCPAANRELDQVQNMIGLFINTLAIRNKLEKESNFESLVKNVNAVLRDALSAQSYPFEKLIDDLELERNPSRNPLFDVFVALENENWSKYSQPPLCMEALELPHTVSKFDLSFYFKEREDDSFAVHIEYCSDLFSKETIKRMSERLNLLLEDVLHRKRTSLSALEILPESEASDIRFFNDTSILFETESDADSFFRIQAAKTGLDCAITDSRGHSLSYAELDAKVSALAAFLAARGLGHGDYAGVCFERSLEMMVCIFAVMRVGATYVPLSTGLPESRLQSIFEDLGSCLIITDREHFQKFEECGQKVVTPDILNLPAAKFEGAEIAPDSVAYAIFTSGSTGRPKGVLIEQRSLINRIFWMQSEFPIGPEDVILQKTTVSFDVSVWELFWWSWFGAGLALLEPEAEKDPQKIVEAISDFKVTVIHFVPSMLRAFLDHLEASPAEVRKLESLRFVFTSGEALPRELVVRFKALLHTELHNLYGPTEAAIDVSWYPCGDNSVGSVPIGRPVSNTALYILDEQMQMVPLGVTGEIYISGIQVARGYVNRPELTAEKFLNDPFSSGRRMYRTGDLGRWLPDGNIEYLGRNDDQVKIRGFRIELGEVESALTRCSGISQAVVRVCKVGGYAALEAFLLPSDGVSLKLLTIRKELLGLLPDYMCPSFFYEVEEIPLSPSGKADRKQITGTRLLPDDYAEENTLTDLQEEIRRVWHKVVPQAGSIGPDQGFFEIGGNSLLLVQLHKLLNEKWDGVFSVASLFSESTIRLQAEFIRQTENGAELRIQNVSHNAPVAVIGMAVRIGDYEDYESFWNDLANGVDKNVDLPVKRQREVAQIFDAVGFTFDASRLRKASYLSDISSFDYKRFGLSPNDASLLDPQQRIFLETALSALDDAGYGGESLEGQNVGTFVGASPYRLFQDALSRSFPDQGEQIYLLNVPSNVVARISYLKNWNGPAETVDTACSSVLKAVHDACQSLRSGESSVALVGGAHLLDLPLKSEKSYAIESDSGLTRTFDAGAEGVGAGEGSAVFVLKLLSQAEKDNDFIHAVIAGSAVNQDGKSSSMAAPNPSAQADVISLAARNASVKLSDIDFFEAHGTATVLGDPVEIEAIGRAFAHEKRGDNKSSKAKAFIGSVKGNLGHLDSAAGSVGLAKAVLSLEKGLVPPQPHFEKPNPHIDFEAAPVRVARRLEKLPEADKPWFCGVSSFGLSGINAHIIVKGYNRGLLPQDDGRWYCVPLSANDEEGLKKYCRQIHEAVMAHEDWPLHAIAGTLISGREQLEYRVAVIAADRNDFLAKIGGAINPVKTAINLNHGLIGKAFDSEKEALAVAEEFLQGRTILWPDSQPVYKINLPPTPFSRKALWPKFSSRFLSEPVKTPSGTAFRLDLGRSDFWPVSEHLLNNIPTLVGMGSLGLIAEAVGRDLLCIENLVWHRPVSCIEGSLATIYLKDENKFYSFELQHFQDEKWQLAVSAKVLKTKAVAPSSLDVEALRLEMNACHVEGEQTLINVSERWHCRESLWVSAEDDRLLAFLSLPEEYRQDLNSFKWHPAMMDIAASLALHKSAGFVPASCGKVELYRPLCAEVYAYVQITAKGSRIITADCTVANKSGQVLLKLFDLNFISMQPGEVDPELYKIQWEKAELPDSALVEKGRILLVGSRDSLLYGQLADFADFSRDILATDKISLSEEIKTRDISHIIYLPPVNSGKLLFAELMQDILKAGLKKSLSVVAVGSGAFTHNEQLPDDALVLGTILALKQEEPLLSGSYLEFEEINPAALKVFKDSLGQIDGACLINKDAEICFQKLKPLSVSTDAACYSDGCVVISGGLGAMALTFAEKINSEIKVPVVLLHRKADAGEDLPFISYRCDVNDRESVKEVFARIRKEVGPVQGVIHTAGIAGDGYLVSKKMETFESVLEPKTTGTLNLHEATLRDDLKFFVMASSRTSLVGAPGQSDYTAANAYLNSFAMYRRHLGLPALSICWNTWAKIGMAARMNTDSGGFTLDPEQAFMVFDQALKSGTEQVVVGMPGEDIGRYKIAGFIEQEVQQTEVATSSSEADLLEIFRDCLGYDSELSREDDFYELGGDSISGTRIVVRIEEVLGVNSSVIDLLESDSIGDFIDTLLAENTKRPEKKGIEPAPIREKYPVGREQLSIIYAELMGNGHTAFNLPAFLKLPKNLDKQRLEESICALIERHEVLRTFFCDFEEEYPQMVVHPFEGFKLKEIHLSELSQKDLLIRPFDLKNGPLFRATLLNINDTEYVLFFDVHHALADGRTISLLNSDLFKFYYSKEIEPVGLQQKDIAWYQFNNQNEEDKKYWHNIFSGELPVLNLPSDFKRPKVHTNRGETYEFELSEKLVSVIKDLSRKEGVTNYNIVLSAWSLLIHKYTGDDDFVIAINVDSRGENLNTAGMLASLFPLRLNVDGRRTISEVLKDNQRISNEAQRHNSYILNDLLTDIHPPVSLDRTMLSEVIISYMNYEFADGEHDIFETLHFKNPASKADISIFVSDAGGRISFVIEYYADLFSSQNILKMCKDFKAILKLMTESDSNKPLDFEYVAERTAAGEVYQRNLSRKLSSSIRRLSRQKKVSTSAVLLSTFATLIHRITLSKEFAVDLGGAVPILFEMNEDMEFEELLSITNENILTALNERGDRCSQHLDLYSKEPLMSVAFECELSSGMNSVNLKSEHSYSLICSVREHSEEIVLIFDCDPEVMDAEKAENLLKYYEIFLEGITNGDS